MRVDPFFLDDATGRAVFVGLLTAHAIGDFLLQSRTMVERKGRLELLAFVQHGLIHAVLVLFLASPQGHWLLAPIVFVLHLAIDLGKEIARREFRRHGRLDPLTQLKLFVGDQFLHLLSILVLVELVQRDIPRWLGSDVIRWMPAYAPDAFAPPLLVLAGWIFATRAGAIVIGLAVAHFQPDLRDGPRDAQESVLDTEVRGLHGGGQMIGTLERTLIYLFVMAGFPAGMGFLLAAKSILRFGDANDRDNRRQAEYIIIGTLMSFTWGYGIAVFFRAAVRVMFGSG